MHPVWDLPTRAFHWLLVVGVFLGWLSHELEWYRVHLWNGYAVLVLVGFRIGWGFVGSAHSRFADFLRGPGAVVRYLRGEEPPRPGHSPLGGWAVAALLALVLGQGLTGLFNSDGLLLDGPLHHALGTEWTDRLGAWHETLFWVLCGMVALHVAAVLVYQFHLRQNLLLPMLTGGETGRRPPVSSWRAVLVALLCAGLLALAVYLAPEPQLPW